jgi:hypothetical protein
MDSTRIDKVLAIPLHNVSVDTPLLEERTP